MKKSAESNLKNVKLHLGGKSALIICDDADLENTLDFAIDGSFRNTSQNGACSARILVQEGIHKEFVNRFIERVKGLKVGDAFEKQNFM
jgi:acyl-CoA reductase-like NAD-dependent aldehyde dehydrogenase